VIIEKKEEKVMPTKKGAGGHQQNYDSHGRYCKMLVVK